MDNRFEFRAWHRMKKVMLQVGDDFGTTTPLDPIMYYKQGQPVILMQFTGLLDKNGKKIFEGDITEDSTGLCLIMWNVEFASFGSRRNGWAFDHFFGEALDPKDCEIIGNVYESPELLEES